MPASIRSIPRSARAACSLTVDLGAAVVRSTTTCPARPCARRPSSPATTASTTGLSGSDSSTTSAAPTTPATALRRAHAGVGDPTRLGVVAHHGVARADDPPRDAPAHVAQTDDPDDPDDLVAVTAVVCHHPSSIAQRLRTPGSHSPAPPDGRRVFVVVAPPSTERTAPVT